jgi:transcriptional regulator with XRE-family HTH domain
MAKAADRMRELIEDAKARGLTKSQIARAIGITPQHLSNLLGGKNEWKLTQIEAVCEVLGISLAEAFLEKGEDAELFVLLRKILDAGPEPYRAIAWNIQGISKQIAIAGPKLERRLTKVASIKKKANG